MNVKFIPYIQLTLATCIIGSSIVVSKIITTTLPIYISQSISLFIALLILFPIAFYMEKGFFKLSLKNHLILFLQALTGMFLFRVFIMYGLRYTTAMESGIITSTTPAIVAALSFFLLKESLKWNKIMGIGITIFGILIINLINASENAHYKLDSIFGNFLILLAVFGEALLTILRKMSQKNVSSTIATTIVSFYAFILFLFSGIFEARKFDFSSISSSGWFYIAYYGIVATALAYILWFKGVSNISASSAAVFTGLIPVWTVILSSIILNESFSILHLLGIIFVFTGILFITVIKESNISQKSNST